MFICIKQKLTLYYMFLKSKSSISDENWLNWFQNRDLGLILWENEAVRLINIFRSMFEQINIYNIYKF